MEIHPSAILLYVSYLWLVLVGRRLYTLAHGMRSVGLVSLVVVVRVRVCFIKL